MLTAVIGGVISDRTGRRKRPVTVSGLVMAVAALLLAFVADLDRRPSWRP